MGNKQLSVLTLHAEYILTNPKKLLGYGVMNEAREVVGVLGKEQVHEAVSVNALNSLTDDQRSMLFSNYCRFCGSRDPGCQCWNDD